MIKSKIEQYWGIIVLIVWGALLIGLSLLRFDPYGIEENAAKALLLNWSVADRVVNPIVTLGAPDFRALLFLPLGAYWSGSFVALKVYTALLFFGAVVLLYRWSKKRFGDEAALISSGLLLIAPLSLMQINSIGTGPFLLLGFGVGMWLDKRYRERGKPLGGWYFAQMLLVVTMVTIHPAGLAYPLALAWEWKHNPVDNTQRKQMQIGIAAAAVFALIFRFGWPGIEWGLNPMESLGILFSGKIPGDPLPTHWTAGIIPALLLITTLFYSRKEILKDMLSRMLVLALVLGLASADYGWALLALATLLYLGAPLLIKANNALGAHSFAGQRGIVMIALFIFATLFMLGDRSYRGSVLSATVSPSDDIIRALAVHTEEIEEPFNTSSQWPARTMLALKRPVFPLPPAAETPEEFQKMIGKITFIIFDPFDPANKALRDNIAASTKMMETLIQQPDGVIVKVDQD